MKILREFLGGTIHSFFKDRDVRREVRRIAGGSSYLVSTVELTDAQIKALPTTGVEIIAAPGANKMIQPVFFTMFSTTAVGGQYTNINAASYIFLETDSGYYATMIGNDNLVQNTVTNMLGTDGNVNQWVFGPIQKGYFSSNFGVLIPEDANSSGVVNAAVKIKAGNGGSNFTGGNAANTLKVIVYYTIIDL